MTMRINVHTYTDDFYDLRTMVRGKDFTIKYSPGTNYDDAVADFKEQVRKELSNTEDRSK